jgi:hypothetical protein
MKIQPQWVVTPVKQTNKQTIRIDRKKTRIKLLRKFMGYSKKSRHHALNG